MKQKCKVWMANTLIIFFLKMYHLWIVFRELLLLISYNCNPLKCVLQTLTQLEYWKLGGAVAVDFIV